MVGNTSVIQVEKTGDWHTYLMISMRLHIHADDTYLTYEYS